MLRSFLTRSSQVLRTTNVRFSSDYASKFAAAQADLKKLKEEPDNDVKLKLYALFKQATVGDVSGSQPSKINFVARAKYDAWAAMKGISNEEAQKKYADLVTELRGQEASESSGNESSSSSEGGIDGLKITVENNVMTLLLNRPKKFNAITMDIYKGITKALTEVNDDPNIHMVVLTGAGEYYCAGNDLSNFSLAAKIGKEKLADMSHDICLEFVNSIVKCNKPLIALINGPAIGISVTTLPLFNCVIASDKATFYTPFATLGQTAEGTSTYTFPLLMGFAKASEVLMLGKKLTAQEAYERNIVSEVIPASSFHEEAQKRVAKFAKFYPKTMNVNATLLRDVHRENLLKVSASECLALKNSWLGKECEDAIMKFMSRKN